MALILHHKYWNYQKKDDKDDTRIGSAKKTGIGTEAARAIMKYAQFLVKNGHEVPSDINSKQQNEIDKYLKSDECLKKGKKTVFFYEQSEVDGKLKKVRKAVYLPFKELRATSNISNIASVKILDKVFKVGQKNGGTREIFGPEKKRYLYKIKLHKTEVTEKRVSVEKKKNK